MNKFFSLIFACNFIIFGSLNAQRLLQIEVFKEVKAIKIYEGQTIKCKSHLYGDKWEERTIEKIIVADSTIVFEDGFIKIKDLQQIQLVNQTARLGGKMLQGFGLGWFLFGTIAHFTQDNNKWTWTDASIGATAVGIGLLMDKVVAKKTLIAGKNAHFRLLDISFPTPEEVNSY